MFPTMTKPMPAAFNFAGFSFPRYVATLPTGPLSKRLQRAKSRCTGPYYHSPTPIAGTHPGRGFYLDSDGQPFTRWRWADDVADIDHTGWFCDEYGDDKLRGIVAALPHGRGFLAGWSMGIGMASVIDGTIYTDEKDAAHAADDLAEDAAENEREYRENQNEQE